MNGIRFFKKKAWFVAVIFVVFSFFLIHIVQAVAAGTSDPGTDTNPLVSQDYVDAKVNEVNTKVTDFTTKINDASVKIADLTAKLTDANTRIADLTAKEKAFTETNDSLIKQVQDLQDHGVKFEIIKVKAGQQLIAGASAEIILRGPGKATAIASAAGGVSDLISGTDNKTGTALVKNHLLLVPAADGRGFKAIGDLWVLIKGTYTIK